MSKYLIVGGAGFIGSNLAEGALRAGDDVRVLDNFATGRRQNLEAAAEWAAAGGARFELLEGDIRDAATCREAMQGVDFVLHQAAIPSVQRSVDDPVLTNGVNINGTLNLLQAGREAEVSRFVFASSSSLYGESETLPKKETMQADPISPYGLQKLAGEKYCVLFHRLYGLPTVALRYFNVFGPRQDPNSEYSAVIPKFVTAVRDGKKPLIHGDGEQTRDFTFVSDVVRANRLACQAGAAALGEAYNIACNRRISLNDLVLELARLTGQEVHAEHGPARPGDIRHSLASVELAGERLGFHPEVDLTEGLRRTLEAY